RLQAIGDARIAIEETQSGSEPKPHAATNLSGRLTESGLPVFSKSRHFLPWAVAVLLSVITGIGAWRLKPAEMRPVSRVTVTLPMNVVLAASGFQGVFANPIAFSPDGSHLVYAATSGLGNSQLFVRAMAASEATPLS